MAQYVQKLWNTSPQTIKVFQNLSQLCSTYVHLFSNICSNSVHSMITISVIIRQNLPKCDKVCSIFAQIMSLLCPNYVENFFQNMSKIRSKTVNLLLEICSKYARNITNLSLVYVENIFTTVQNLFKKCNI